MKETERWSPSNITPTMEFGEGTTLLLGAVKEVCAFTAFFFFFSSKSLAVAP